jgi:hypothetical protein
MKSPETMTPVQLRHLCKQKGLDMPRTASKAQLLEALGVVKKGKRTWKPAKVLDIRVPDEVKKNFALRWRDKDSQNIQRALAEGWHFFDPSKGLRGIEHDHSSTSVPEYRELVLMALPREDKLARDEYINARTDRQTNALKHRLQEDLDTAAKREGGYKTKAEGRIEIIE